MWLTLLCFGFLFWIAVFVKRWRKYVAIVDQVPGPKPILLIGNISTLGTFKEHTAAVPQLAIYLQSMKALNELYGKDGIYRLWLGLRPLFAITSYKTAEIVLNSNTLISKSVEYDRLHAWLGQGLLTSTGAKWKSRRRLLTPGFHFRILEDFLDVINEQSKIFTSVLKKSAKEDWIDIVSLMSRFTLDIICETAMGVSVNAMSEEDNIYLQKLHRLSCLFIERTPRPWLWTDAVYYRTQSGKDYLDSIKYLHDFTRKVIRERKATFQIVENKEKSETQEELTYTSPNRKRLAFLDILLNEHMKDPTFLEEDVREEVDTFMFEGHDTTALGLSWTFYLIGLYPEVQKKICEELEYIFGDDEERNVTFEDLKEMKYLECVIKEAHRLYPPVPYVGRSVTEETVINGYTIPKGSRLWILFFVFHRDPKVFPDPEVFNPDNFLPENSSGRNAFAHTPFSAGPRNCIGQKFALMEEKTAITNVLRKFTVESLDARDKVLGTATIILRPVGPLRIRIREKGQPTS